MNHLLFLNVGGSELIIIALFVLMFFGSKSIPEFMRGLGKMTREFKDAMNGLEREVRQSVNYEEPAISSQPPKQLEEKSISLTDHSEGQEESKEKKSATEDPSFGGYEPKADEHIS